MKRTSLMRTLAAGVAVAVVLPATMARGSAGHSSSFPPQLVGRWTRTVTRADVTREEANPTLDNSVCTFTVKAGGGAHIVCPRTPGAVFNGKVIPKGANHVQILFGDVNPNTYRWAVAGSTLTLTKLEDPTPDRSAVLSGMWRRK